MAKAKKADRGKVKEIILRIEYSGGRTKDRKIPADGIKSVTFDYLPGQDKPKRTKRITLHPAAVETTLKDAKETEMLDEWNTRMHTFLEESNGGDFAPKCSVLSGC
jgi:hypothetical protein